MKNYIQLGEKCIHRDMEQPYLIAEIGTNHDQSIEDAMTLIAEAASAGFDCVKFQTYEPYEIVGKSVRSTDYGLDKYYGDIPAYDMFERFLKTPKHWFPKLKEMCRSVQVDCATTIHGSDGLRWANEIGFDLIKVASMDHDNIPFLKSLVNVIEAPLLVSFGMATLDDVDNAISILKHHERGIGMFHCVSLYPPQPEEMRLCNIAFYRDRFSVPVGFSDHADDVVTSLPALLLGATIFEKHVTLDKSRNGPDHAFALEPSKMKSYVKGIRELANKRKSFTFSEPCSNELAIRKSFMKSIVVTKDLRKGHCLTDTDIALVRPGTGLPPKEYDKVLKKHINKDLVMGSLLSWDDLDGAP